MEHKMSFSPEDGDSITTRRYNPEDQQRTLN